MTEKTRISRGEWIAEARRRFGDDPKHWRFVCPACGHEQSLQDFIDAGVEEPAVKVAFSCIGRWTGHMDVEMGAGQPCNYAGGGLFQLNPVIVVDDEGEGVQAFAFAEEARAA